MPDLAPDLLPLQYAQVRRVGGVMHIPRSEYYSRSLKGKVQMWQQSWTCATNIKETHPLLVRVQNSLHGSHLPRL